MRKSSVEKSAVAGVQDCSEWEHVLGERRFLVVWG